MCVDSCLPIVVKLCGAVNNGQAALDAALKLRPDVVVLDISMPVMNGIQAAKRLREANPDARIVFLTVDKDPDTCHAALQTGCLGLCVETTLGHRLDSSHQLGHSGPTLCSQGCE